MVTDSGDDLGVGGLEEECPDAAYESGDVTDHQPRHRSWPQ